MHKKIRNFKALASERALAQMVLEIMQSRTPDYVLFEIIGQPIPEELKPKIQWTASLLVSPISLGQDVSSEMVAHALGILSQCKIYCKAAPFYNAFINPYQI